MVKAHICRHCGRKFDAIRSTMVFCCAACRRAYTADQKAEKAGRPAHYKKPRGKYTPDLTLDEVVALADAAGMSYGRYVAAQRMLEE